MIPLVNESGVLPPFLPQFSPVFQAAVAPYRISLSELIVEYSFSNTRKTILSGLLEYRRILKNKGITQGFQWIDGSFTEDCEKLRERGPSDIDLATFAVRPDLYSDNASWELFVANNENIFKPNIAKEKYLCDAYYIDLNTHPFFLVRNISYWYGLFSHQRDTYIWKGMLEVNLSDNEDGFDDLLELEVGDD